MRLSSIPTPLLHLITTILLTSQPVAANPHPAASAQNGFSFDELFARYYCAGTKCGQTGQYCCGVGEACYTNAQTIALCTPISQSYAPAYSSYAGGGSSYAAGGGYYTTITKIYTMTNLEVITSVTSSWCPSASGGIRCNAALNENPDPCGNTCCRSNEYCANPAIGQCKPAYAGQTTTTTVAACQSCGLVPAAGPAIRGTSSDLATITNTENPSVTQSFVPPVAAGGNVTMSETHGGGGGLSGGAIAGIVIGVLLALALLGLICFYCCIKGIFDGILAIFGLGGRKRRVTEVDEYERRTHHGSSGGVKRTWYGAAKPSRVDRREKRDSKTGRHLLEGVAGLGALWAILGLKRRSNRRNEEKYSEYSYSSDYYTSSSSASSDDRRTRNTRHSQHRSISRR